ncbi:hypothetical protein BJX63DRAFT_241009 [Aspergillus granulosus]|uniref:Zn(2)-C6 fungal-type domain-containing protein n=1 Tax=Aspergillus granulosus TaxID=176169 RepID=A0ABR4HAZ1_9EURO
MWPNIDSDRLQGEDNRRRRSALACNVCRARRTKCDGQRPKCSFCTERGRVCSYEEPQNIPPSPLKGELSKLWEQLDFLTEMVQGQNFQGSPSAGERKRGASLPTPVVPQDFPFMTLQSASFMNLIGLDSSLSSRLEHMERGRPAILVRPSRPRIVVTRIQDASCLMNAFMEHIQIWYPLLHAEFTDEMILAVTSGFTPSVSSCLALLVLAIGSVVELESILDALERHPEERYIHAAMDMLPCIFADSSPQSAQCLLLFAVYHLLYGRPWQAHDNVAMASFKLQEYLTNQVEIGHDTTQMSITANCFWSALLIESEILVQLDLVSSGIWSMSSFAPAPTGSNTWIWPISQSVDYPTPTPSERDSGPYHQPNDLSYFVAEIAMRKMLQRCTWATSTPDQGSGHVYAPIVAAELERQLDQWHQLLPEPISFSIPRDVVEFPPYPRRHPNGAQVAFLRTQYYAFKASIYWPAVYEALTVADVSEDLLRYCERFFSSYTEFVASAVTAVAVCRPNLWTLCTSVFTISMATLAALAEPCPFDVVPQGVLQGLRLAVKMFDGVKAVSPSLAEMGSLLAKRIRTYDMS